MAWVSLIVALITMVAPSGSAFAETLRVGVFDVDASPPVGSPLAYDPTKGVQTPLSCRGLVLLGAGKPIVLCAVDWIGVANGGQTAFREALASAVDTDADRVAVHALHQHDAPRCDFAAEELLNHRGVGGIGFDPAFARDVVQRVASAAKRAAAATRPVTHLGIGNGVVEKVASNRRILGPDGKVQFTRWTATKDPALRAFPAGVIDPQLKLISLWNEDQPLVALTYYATHPQSYYRTGMANPDFPGLARNARQEKTGVSHIHFNGAGGNIGAGKWNDGSPENRQVLADRVARGMELAWDNVRKTPLSAENVSWQVAQATLPAAKHLDSESLRKVLDDPAAQPAARYTAATKLVWLKRCEAEEAIDVACLTLGDARILHLPGELFVEYQLAAQKMRPDLFVALAAYGDYAPGYIGTEIAYDQGGYETSERASSVAPAVESVLMAAINQLLSR